MSRASSSTEIAERLLAGDRAALSRLISWAENGDPGFPAALAALWPRVGRAARVGVTGPPGAGKSTLVNELVGALREQGAQVGVLAIDPSSPFTGGALLGDRIRMEQRTSDPGVYIRSMASRKSHGGMARAAADACDVMDAFGFERIVVETVGVGQAEYDVMSAVDTVVVVLCPGAGDGIQAMKAGLLEVADVLVVNKSDLPGADLLRLDLEDALRLRSALAGKREAGWQVPVLSVSAHERTGLADLTDALARHQAALAAGADPERRLRKRVQQVRRVVGERLDQELWGPGGFTEQVETSLRKSITPYDVAQEILERVRGSAGRGARADQLPPQRSRS